MLKLTWIEFFLRLIPESFVIIWGIYVISNQSINKSKYVICSISIALVTFLVRFLPIHFGIHTIIVTVFMVCALIIVGIPLLKSIYGVILITLLLLVGELINMILFNIFKVNIDIAFKNSFVKCILELPSLIFLILSIVLIRFLLNRKEGIKDDFN